MPHADGTLCNACNDFFLLACASAVLRCPLSRNRLQDARFILNWILQDPPALLPLARPAYTGLCAISKLFRPLFVPTSGSRSLTTEAAQRMQLLTAPLGQLADCAFHRFSSGCHLNLRSPGPTHSRKYGRQQLVWRLGTCG